MTIPLKKLKTGFSIPVLGLGTWLVGGSRIKNPLNDDEKDIESIQNAIRLGITHIDTAEMYAQGHAEILVGKAIQPFIRKNLFITTKVWKTNLAYNDVLSSCENSLKRLNTSYIDLYLIHMPNPDIPIVQTVKALNRLKKEGLIHHIGVSDFTITRLKDAQQASSYPIVANQVHYNLMVREIEAKGILSYCQKNSVIIIAWRPVQQGMLTTVTNPLMEKMCNRYQKTPSQIAINWLTSQKNVVVISKMQSKSHQEENIKALGWNLKSADIEALRKKFPDQVNVSPSVPLI